MRRRLFGLLVLSALSATIGGAACGGSDEKERGSASNDASLDPDGGFQTDALGNETGVLRCLSDLQTIVDATGNVVGKCPPDQGCLNGACVAPCDAAAGNKTSIGCEFYALEYPSVTSETSNFPRGACFSVVVANTWPTPTKLTVTRGGTELDVTSFARLLETDGSGSLVYAPVPSTGLPPGSAAVLFLSHDPRFISTANIACPSGVTPALVVDAAIHATGKSDAFRIRADRPVTSYAVHPWGGALSFYPSATLLIPSSTWDVNYVAPGIRDAFTVAPASGGSSATKPFTAVIAREDGTTVTVLPKVPIVGGGSLPATAASVPVTYSLNRGEYLQLVQAQNLGGSVFSSNKPIGMFVGAQLLTIDGEADNSGTMVLPVRALGSEYVAALYEVTDTTSPPIWQLVGSVDGTALTYDPARPTGAPATLGSGEVVEFEAPDGFLVRSQDKDHPFNFAVYRRRNHAPGGPEYVSLLPAAQYLRRYVFATDPTHTTTTLVVVRQKSASGFADVTLDCAGVLTGWKNIGSSDYQMTRVVFGAGNTCKNGRREATSDGQFGITVWGFSTNSSYGYPAGGNVEAVNEVVVPTIK